MLVSSSHLLALQKDFLANFAIPNGLKHIVKTTTIPSAARGGAGTDWRGVPAQANTGGGVAGAGDIASAPLSDVGAKFDRNLLDNDGRTQSTSSILIIGELCVVCLYFFE